MINLSEWLSTGSERMISEPIDILVERLRNFKSEIDLVVAPLRMEKFRNLKFTKLESQNYSKYNIKISGRHSPSIYITDPDNKIGEININVNAPNFVLFIDNAETTGALHCGRMQIEGEDSTVFLGSPLDGWAAIYELSLRRAGQFFYWGHGSTSVGINVEIQGANKGIFVGDDALISSGVWVRNHDMHGLIDSRNLSIINSNISSILIEPHVWIGQDAMILKSHRIGFGSVIGAKSLVSKNIPPESAVGGVPARLLRANCSWCRSFDDGIRHLELERLKSLRESRQSMIPGS